jgi:isomerase DpgB
VVAVQVDGVPDTDWTRDLTVALISKWERAVRRFERLPMATVGLAVGDCGGTALDVLLATDRRIAAPGTRLVVPATDGVAWPGMALYRLGRQAGQNLVRQMALFGTTIEAKEALTAQVLTEVTSDLKHALAEAAAALGRFSGPDLAIRRQLLSDAATRSFEDVLGMHLAACDRTLRRSQAEQEAAAT